MKIFRDPKQTFEDNAQQFLNLIKKKKLAWLKWSNVNSFGQLWRFTLSRNQESFESE